MNYYGPETDKAVLSMKPREQAEYLLAQGWSRIWNPNGGAWWPPEGGPIMSLNTAVRVAVARSLRREVEK